MKRQSFDFLSSSLKPVVVVDIKIVQMNLRKNSIIWVSTEMKNCVNSAPSFIHKGIKIFTSAPLGAVKCQGGWQMWQIN